MESAGCFFPGSSAGIPITLSGVFVTPYFHRYRTAAVGVYMAGSSILSIVAPSIMQFCLDTYQFSGTLLLCAGFCMQGIPAALLLFTIDIPEAPPPPKLMNPTMKVRKFSASEQDVSKRNRRAAQKLRRNTDYPLEILDFHVLYVPSMEKSSQERIDINPSGKRIPIVVLRQLSGNRVS